jgi:hypothetical protein
VVHQHLAVALRHAHRRQDGAGGIGAHQQVDLVGGHQLLVQRARQVGLALVVLQHPFQLAAQPAAALVDLVDVDLADQLVHLRGGRQRPGQRQRAADADGLALRVHDARQAGCGGQAGGTGTQHGAAVQGGVGHGLSPVRCVRESGGIGVVLWRASV